jgi:tetratricopeptide (TPR) repeat protein
MKNLVYLFLLITNLFFAQSGIENGNTLYKQGNYQEAIDTYETIIYRSQKQSPELYFNLGNCYYKLNKVAPTIFNYEKALVLNPDFEAAKTNLEIAKKLQIDDIKVIPKVGIGRMILKVFSVFHHNTWACISVGFALLFLLFFIAYYFTEISALKRTFFTVMLVVFGMMFISLLAAISLKNAYDNDKPAIVFAEVTSLFNDSKSNKKELLKLHEGTKVFVKETQNNYKKVQLTDNTEGWILSKDIIEVK